jgi:hypothetical protein
MDSYFAQNMTQQAFQAQRDRIDDEKSERYYDSLSSKKSAPDTPAYRELQKKSAERWEQYDRRHFPNMHNSSSSNTSSSSSKSTNLFSSWFGKK